MWVLWSIQGFGARSLLGASKVHGNTELSEIAAMHLFKLEPDNAGNYVLFGK